MKLSKRPKETMQIANTKQTNKHLKRLQTYKIVFEEKVFESSLFKGFGSKLKDILHYPPKLKGKVLCTTNYQFNVECFIQFFL